MDSSFFILISLLCTLPALASTYDGYYVTLNNDTIWGTIKTPECTSYHEDRIHLVTYDNLYERQFKMTFEDSLGNTTPLIPTSVSIIVMLLPNGREVYVSGKTLDGEHIFLKYVVLGKVNLLAEYYSYIPLSGQAAGADVRLRTCSVRQERYYILKDNGKLLPVYVDFFKRIMHKFFADDPELISKIEKGIYKYSDLKTIVMEYNYWASTAHSFDKN